MKYYASCNMNAYQCALKSFGLKKACWRSEFERLYPQTEYVLQSLSHKYELGIIANQNTGLSQRLKDFGILNYFQIIISSSDVGFAKPDKRIFTFALNKANCSAEDVYMIGDRLDNDIIPAQNVGIKTVWIKQGLGGLGNPDKLSMFPSYIVENLSELLKLSF